MKRRVLAAVPTAIAVMALPVPAATAQTAAFGDSRTTAGPMDIHRVVVVNENRLQIRVKVDDLQRRYGRSASVWIDKNADRAGAEYFIGSGLYDSDWQIGRAQGWEVVEGPLDCPVDQRLDYTRDMIIWTTGETCLGQYSDIRVSVETRKGQVTDYSPARHRFHRWVARY